MHADRIHKHWHKLMQTEETSSSFVPRPHDFGTFDLKHGLVAPLQNTRLCQQRHAACVEKEVSSSAQKCTNRPMPCTGALGDDFGTWEEVGELPLSFAERFRSLLRIEDVRLRSLWLVAMSNLSQMSSIQI
jgi:hypothetical protein